jgi:hypothetical protein
LLGCGSSSADHAAKATAAATYPGIARNSRRVRGRNRSRENSASGRQADIAGFSAGAFVVFRVEDKG